MEVIQLTRERATSLGAILSVLRDCERAWSTSRRIRANYKSREGSQHDPRTASALLLWNQQPAAVATIARIGSRNG